MKASPVRADQNVAGLTAAPVTGGTGTSVRPGGTYARQPPSATNAGTGPAGTVRIGVGTSGSSAAATAAVQRSRPAPGRRAWSYARSRDEGEQHPQHRYADQREPGRHHQVEQRHPG